MALCEDIHQRNKLEGAHAKAMHQQYAWSLVPFLPVMDLGAVSPAEPFGVLLHEGLQSLAQPRFLL